MKKLYKVAFNNNLNEIICEEEKAKGIIRNLIKERFDEIYLSDLSEEEEEELFENEDEIIESLVNNFIKYEKIHIGDDDFRLEENGYDYKQQNITSTACDVEDAIIYFINSLRS